MGEAARPQQQQPEGEMQLTAQEIASYAVLLGIDPALEFRWPAALVSARATQHLRESALSLSSFSFSRFLFDPL